MFILTLLFFHSLRKTDVGRYNRQRIISVIAIGSLVLLSITGSIIIRNRKKLKQANVAVDRLNHEIWFTLPLAPGDVIQRTDQRKPAVNSGLHEMPELTETELAWLREHMVRSGTSPSIRSPTSKTCLTCRIQEPPQPSAGGRMP